MSAHDELCKLTSTLTGAAEKRLALSAVERALDKPNLGLATTEELLVELMARAEIGGYASYRTAGGEE